MHHPRLVGGLISLAALLTVLLVSSALVAASPPAPSATPAPALPTLVATLLGVVDATASSATTADGHQPALTEALKRRCHQQ